MTSACRRLKKRIRFGLTAACLLVFLPLPSARAAADALSPPFPVGETIIYDIKKLKLTVGEATLVFNGMTEVNGQKALSITFTAAGFKFFDEEKIYIDPATFYPFVINRDLNIFGKKEKMVEFYDPQKGRVRIVKTAGGKTSERVIENGKRFDNIYGFIYRYRHSGRFAEDAEFHLHLPTHDVRFELVEKRKLQAADHEFDVFYLRSVPKKYKVWFDRGPGRIPVRIDGALGFGHTSMVLRSHNGGEAR